MLKLKFLRAFEGINLRDRRIGVEIKEIYLII